ncbi:MAG: hypothetical protein KDM63_14635 [Verrucomicrobiae bacterium]|nr:hypothetical protein [Verrucomicrobiae bacterium]
MAEDAGIEALGEVWPLIKPLPASSRRRVLRFLEEMCADEEAKERLEAGDGNVRGSGHGKVVSELSDAWKIDFQRQISLHRIRSDSERVLVVAAALQEAKEPGQLLSASEIHRVLKSMGFGVSNIASLLRAMSQMERKPSHFRRFKTGLKGRWRYEVTETGKREAAGLMGRNALRL